TAARIITDRETGRSRGFGFVEMGDATQGRAAMAALNGATVNGRELTVNEAKPREERGPRGGGYGGGGGSRW
ncbi:MAG: RNA-binding protein, partial [Chloroflexi bacterium]|nr:RNA-binding protein [Chloroflexota bacterium]